MLTEWKHKEGDSFETCEDNQIWDTGTSEWISREKEKPCTGFAMIQEKCM